MTRVPWLAIAALLGCGSDDAHSDADTDPSPPGTGSLALTFRIDEDYRDRMDEVALGTFYGAFWRGSDVTSLGPNEGAVDLGSIEVAPVDLTGDPTGVLFTSGELPAEEVVVLGFLDSDANALPGSPEPDKKDPVTLPNDNDFDVVAGAETEVEVFLGFLNP